MRNWKFSHVDESKLEIPADCYSVQSVFVRSCECSVWSKLSLYVVACYFTQKIQISPNGPSTPLYPLGSFGCLLLSSLLTFCWAFVRLQFDDCTFLMLFLLWLGSIIQRDRLLCLARSLLGTLADILIGLLSQFQWKALIFDIDILLLLHPSIFLILCFIFALLENEECYTFKTGSVAVKRLFSWPYKTPTLRFSPLVYSG